MGRTKHGLAFKDQVVRKVIDRGHPAFDVAKRLGISESVLYTWVSKFEKADPPLAADLKRCRPKWPSSRGRSGEARYPKKGRSILCHAVRMKYAFMQTHCREFRLAGMSRVLRVHRGGYPVWRHEPVSPRGKINVVLTQRIRESYDQGMGICGSPRIFCDLREAGLACSENRVVRLMRATHIESIRGYKQPSYKSGKPALVAPNQLQRLFRDDPPDYA